MSFANEPLDWYMAGVIHPSGESPFAKRAELTRETMPANTGAEADVPDTRKLPPPITVLYCMDVRATSGYARPVLGKPDTGGVLLCEAK